MTKTLTAMLLCAGLGLSAGCSSDATDLEKNTKTAEKTCGGADKVENVSEEGFTCKD